MSNNINAVQQAEKALADAKPYAKPILEWQIKQLEKDCSSQWTSSRKYEALQNEIKTLQNFINTQL